MRTTRRAHNDLYFLIERHERLHQALERNILELVSSHLRHLWLRHTGDLRRLGLTQPSLLDQLIAPALFELAKKSMLFRCRI